MTPDDLRQSRSAPSGISDELRAMWHEAQGDWEGAHRVVQDVETPDAAWVHAYLHRKEGDQSNARYWYGRAGQPVFRGPLEEEWDHITTALLSR